MTSLTRALHAEFLKSKRTLALWLSLIAPAVIVGLQFAIMIDQHQYYGSPEDPTFSAWGRYTQNVLVLWALLMLPLFVTLETALIAQWEHRSQQWKHLFALPVPRWTLYVAKQICGMVLIGLSTVVLAVLIIAVGLSFRLIYPGLGFEASPPLAELARFALYMYLGSWFIIAIQTWVAQRWSSFAVASAVGIALTVAGVIVIQSDYAGFYPYTLPTIVTNGFSGSAGGISVLEENAAPIRELLFGSLGGLVAAAIGGWRFTRRDVL
ncbi:MAG: ABC transporter permease [Anaerolineae bacterium]|nr:ABC transporter permease [Anaerolineae bacterium]